MMELTKYKADPFAITARQAELFYFRGRKAHREGRLDEAVYHLDEATTLQPADIRYLLRYARVLFETGEINHANDVLKQVRALDASNTEALFYLANNYAHVSLYEEARQHAMEYLEQAPNGKHAEASAALVELIDLEQEMEDDEEDELIRLHGQAQRQIDKGMLFAAQETLTGLIAQYPTFWPAYNNLAIVEFYLGENDQAFASLERVLEGNPGNLHALCNTLVLLHEMGQDEEAHRLSRQLEHVRSVHLETRYKVASTLAIIGRYDIAYEELKLLERRGYRGDPLFGHWLSISAYKTGHVEEAAAFLKSDEAQALKEETDTYDIRHNLQFRSALIQALKTEDDVSRIFTALLLGKLNDAEARLALSMMPEVTDREDVLLLTEQIVIEMEGRTDVVDERIHRALQTIRLAERFVSDEERMSLEGDFYERFAQLVLSGESFDSIEASAASLLYLFHDLRDGILIEECASLVDCSFDHVASMIRTHERMLAPLQAKC
ncbi:tetratricopeptide repeat protein [Exiguobacterium sp. UBA6309]|uniref:tetratricopeptide repeat protein n=1 Tax=Exiguobacterium sp. UBA6309 TaxID=1946499 RepID=UPI0025BA655F|nr:hypothetical protein [Exiguobacterium sp. UBA6309]